MAGASAFLVAQQDTSGGFAEQGRAADGTLTAWAALGLVAANGSPEARGRASEFLRAQDETAATPSDLALRVVALAALGGAPADLVARVRGYRPGALVNATIWTVLALRAAGEAPPAVLVRELRATQSRAGGGLGRAAGNPIRTTRPPPSRRFARRVSVARLCGVRSRSSGPSRTATGASR